MLALIGSAGAGYYFGRTGTPSADAYTDDIELPPGTRHWGGVALSPDGKQLAIVTQPTPSAPDSAPVGADDRRQRVAAGFRCRPGRSSDIRSGRRTVGRSRSSGTANSCAPTFPKLEPVVLCDAPDARGGAWLDDGTVVFAPTPASDLWRVSSQGGLPSMLLKRGDGEEAVKYPVYADGDRFLYWVQLADPSRNEIRMASVSAPDRPIPVVRSGTSPRIRSGNALLHARSRRCRPEARSRVRSTRGRRPSHAHGGARCGECRSDECVSWRRSCRPTDGSCRSIPAGLGRSSGSGRYENWRDRSLYGDGFSSRDGRRLLVSERSSDGDRIWLTDLTSGARRLLTSLVGANWPRWAPDEQAFAFRALTGRGGNGNVYQQRLDGGAAVPLVEGNFNAYPIGWREPGAPFVWLRLAAAESIPLGIFVGQDTTRFGAASTVTDARLSPDGQRIAYEARESGLGELCRYVPGGDQPRADQPRRWHIASMASRWPRIAVRGEGRSDECGDSIRPTVGRLATDAFVPSAVT